MLGNVDLACASAYNLLKREHQTILKLGQIIGDLSRIGLERFRSHYKLFIIIAHTTISY